MSSSRKRPGSPNLDKNKIKYAREDPIIISDDEEEDSMEAILAQIKEQEESEVLAMKLQAQWNGAGDMNATSLPPVASSSRVHNQDVLTINSGLEGESDEAMAKRLSREWQEILSDGDDSILLANSKPTPQSGPTTASSKGKASNRSFTDVNLPPDQKLRQYRDIFTIKRDCPKCGSLVPSPRGYVMFTNPGPPPSLVHLLHAPCHGCNTNHCRGCMSPIPCPVSCKGPKNNSDCKVEVCCANVRAIALFEALGGFDRQFLGEKASSSERARVAAMKARSNSSLGTVGPGGTGYSTDSGNYGYSYGGWHGDGSKGGSRGKGRGRGRSNKDAGFISSNSTEIAAHWEEIVTRAFATFTRYLPDPYSDKAQMYDMIPHESIQSLLALSQLPEILGSLLRNDSVTDWIARSDTYHAMLRLLRRMADCELTIEVILSNGWGKSSSCGLQEWMWQDDEIKWELDDAGTIVRAAPLYTHFKKLTRQCEAFLAGASQLVDAGDNADDDEVEEMAVKGTSLCGDIIATRDDMDRLFNTLGKLNNGDSNGCENVSQNSKGKRKDPLIEMEKSYAQDCERLAFHHVTMSEANQGGGLVYKDFNYSGEVISTASHTRVPKDRLHLVKELAVTATCLPPGVWARVDDVRNDVIKFMVAGPDGTPYAGGLFEFDCFLPTNYPNSPPLMNLRTTGGGRVRFNPNLYSNGKVCLSLLGTWQGRPEEQWQPRKSTLLQVLVSIQGMILIEAPYFNEPGYGKANPNDPRSVNYNREIRLQTVRYAMVEWMKDKYKNHMWADVIASHFGIRNDKIRKCIHEWCKTDPRFRKYTSQTSAFEFDGGLSMGMIPDGVLPTRHHKTHAQEASQDLLVEYDRGIQRINKWPRSVQGV